MFLTLVDEMRYGKPGNLQHRHSTQYSIETTFFSNFGYYIIYKIEGRLENLDTSASWDSLGDIICTPEGYIHACQWLLIQLEQSLRMPRLPWNHLYFDTSGRFEKFLQRGKHPVSVKSIPVSVPDETSTIIWLSQFPSGQMSLKDIYEMKGERYFLRIIEFFAGIGKLPPEITDGNRQVLHEQLRDGYWSHFVYNDSNRTMKRKRRYSQNGLDGKRRRRPWGKCSTGSLIIGQRKPEKVEPPQQESSDEILDSSDERLKLLGQDVSSG